MATGRAAVFLDRDGVLNQVLVRGGKPYSPTNLGEFQISLDASEALKRLRQRGFLLLVVTNQPAVQRGTQSRETLEEMHRLLQDMLPIDDFFVCLHDEGDDCLCRKPRPGLLLEAAEKYRVSLADSFMIGDRWRDVEAGHAAGCHTVWIDRGYRERGPSITPSARVNSLEDAVNYILKSMDGDIQR